MDRSVWRRLAVAAAALEGVSGCGASVSEQSPPAQSRQASAPYEASRPVVVANEQPTKPEVSFDTERDRTFARFLENNAAGMVKKADVKIERRGVLKVEISRAVEPEDTLPLTKSLMAGARKDFPDQPIMLSLFDPEGAPILKARFKPGDGVHYQIAHGEGGTSSKSADTLTPAPSPSADPLARGGVTPRDQKFAAWAEEHGRSMLRYVEADLERHGRLWFGITREVKPADVKPLAQSLLEGARKEFPRGDLVATVFDPDGERIGRAHLGSGGDVRWEK